jgi:type IV pilus assembly protein PilO
MTYSSDLIDSDLATNTSFIAAPAYPSIFGITFSPIVTGSCLAAVGCAISAYLYTGFLQPQIAKNQELETKLSETQNQIEMRKDNAAKIAAAEQNLDLANKQKQVVLSLFANNKKLDTLLLDLNKLINIRQGQLLQFTPVPVAAGSGSSKNELIIKDGALGAALDNKLKVKSVNISLTGNFDQVQSILRTIERLDQLLLIKSLNATVPAQKIRTDSQGKMIPQPAPTIQTTFQIQALIPLTAAEQAVATPPPPPAKK